MAMIKGSANVDHTALSPTQSTPQSRLLRRVILSAFCFD
jgi:hypothetical protein